MSGAEAREKRNDAMKVQPSRHFYTLLTIAIAASLAACGGKNNDDNSVTPDQGMTMADAGVDMTDAGSDDEDLPVVDEDMADMSDMSDMGEEPADRLAIAGLSAPVSAHMDDAGVLFLECATDLDCFAAQGYMHARHRMFAMDLIRRQTRGQIATAVGALGLESDVATRRLMTTRDGTPLEDALYEMASDSTKEAFVAYANGVNAFLDDARNERHGAEFSSEYSFILFNKEIRDWEPEDSVAVYIQLAYQLGEESADDLLRYEALGALGRDQMSDLLTMQTGTTASVFESAGLTPSPNAARPLRIAMPISEQLFEGARKNHGLVKDARAAFASMTSLVFGEKHHAQGSNNWVLEADRTENGFALLANDPHLSLNNPALWYHMGMDSKSKGTGSLHLSGASIPAVPGVLLGHNEKLAWGATTARFDLSDAYIETLNEDGTAVIFNGQEVPLIQKDFTFEVFSGQDETRTFEWVPHHGPIIAKDMDSKTAISVRWVAQESGDDLDFLFELMRAESVAEGSESLKKIRALNQSWVLADTTGAVGWYPHVYLPNRPWASPEIPNWVALPGDGSAEWDGFITGDDLPHAFDPPSGLIVTANADFDGSFTDGDPTNDGHTPWHYRPVQGYRLQRIMDLLAAGESGHTPESMVAIQGDTKMLHAEAIVPALLQVLDEGQDVMLSPEATSVVAALRDWQYECPTGLDGVDPEAAAPTSDAVVLREARGCAAFHVLLTNLVEVVFSDELAAGQGFDFDARENWYILQRPLQLLFTSPESLIRQRAYFDDVSTSGTEEGALDAVVKALTATGQELEKLYDSADSQTWLWGRIHDVTLASFFSNAGIENYNTKGYAMSGGYETVNVAPPNYLGMRDGDYGTRYGASMRLVMEMDPAGPRAWYQLPGGQVHLREDDRYLGLLEDWLSNTPRLFPFTPEEVEANTTTTLTFEVK